VPLKTQDLRTVFKVRLGSLLTSWPWTFQQVVHRGNKTSDTFDSPCGTLRNSPILTVVPMYVSGVGGALAKWQMMIFPPNGGHQTKRRLVWKILSMGVIKSRWQFNQQSARTNTGENGCAAVKWVKPFQKSNQKCLRRLPRWWLNFMSLRSY